MRHAVILAGGSGTRLWPMSRGDLPKQLIPLIGGKSLLEVAFDRLEGLLEPERIHVCAGLKYRDPVLRALPALSAESYLGEPMGRDTLNAVGLAAAALETFDPEAVIGVFTADHVIEPVGAFREIVARGFELAETVPSVLVTFGIAPTGPSQAYGYLQLGESLGGAARVVERFREKPDGPTAEGFFRAGPERYLWNSGMFVWRASTLLDCIRRYEPDVSEGLGRIAEAWGTPRRLAVLEETYPRLKKISVDFAVMEPASADPAVRVAAVPMPLRWLDVGSWTSFAETCSRDERGNALGGGRHLLHETSGTLVASSDPGHLIATIGCRDLIVIHTSDATLVCRREDAEKIKKLHGLVGERFGPDLL